ncbi:alcohol dehydrogenase catalytic domain-containing protein [Egibacter rhizosphaerae]|uniref:alcohol dehydrogenase catalytic domain-containing protein n=1 Tax=Egibacter rhizosphaerae TaxID=1670831 RepID=UPI0013F169CE|nr:alcohol dehydrogenase catalytic domain-containing protein [Egibacter rhizosphaerae]
MRAAVLKEFGAAPVVEEVAEPPCGPSDVLVRTSAAGVCQTDVKIVDGLVPTVELPRVPGHEIAGEVAELGRDVTGFSEGERVLVSLDVSCESCRYCLIGKFDYCEALRRVGFEQDGGWADLVRVPARNLLAVPDGVTLAEAATIPDAVGSPYHAVVGRAGVRVGDVVAVYGLGGLGLAAVQIARVAGARVIAIARTPERRELAEQLGASWSIDPRDGPVGEQVRELTDGLGVDAFFDVVGAEGTVEQGVLACRKGGQVVIVGYVVPEVSAPTVGLVYGEVSIRGSRSSTRDELERATRLVAERRVTPVIGRELGLDEVGRALEELRSGTVIGRPVLTLP